MSRRLRSVLSGASGSSDEVGRGGSAGPPPAHVFVLDQVGQRLGHHDVEGQADPPAQVACAPPGCRMSRSSVTPSFPATKASRSTGPGSLPASAKRLPLAGSTGLAQLDQAGVRPLEVAQRLLPAVAPQVVHQEQLRLLGGDEGDHGGERLGHHLRAHPLEPGAGRRRPGSAPSSRAGSTSVPLVQAEAGEAQALERALLLLHLRARNWRDGGRARPRGGRRNPGAAGCRPRRAGRRSAPCWSG